jgi:hypothetical protein
MVAPKTLTVTIGWLTVVVALPAVAHAIAEQERIAKTDLSSMEQCCASLLCWLD